MNREIELKLEIAPDATERLLEQPWLNDSERRSQRQLSVYFDTPDGELRRRGYTLRVRSAGGKFIQTVKSIDAGAGLFARGEWEYQIDGPEPDSEQLGSTPLAGLDVVSLEPIIRSEVNRTACRLSRDGSEIELDVDRGTMAAAGKQVSVAEVEIELVRGEARSAISLARRIASEVPVKLGVLSKAERGFALADGRLGRVTKAEAVPVQPGMTVTEGFEAIVAACLRHFRLNEPLVIDRRTPDALHQSRVAMRRLRSALTLFRSAIVDDEYMHLREELRWFTGELGDARNLDVYLRREEGGDERDFLQDKRERAYDAVIEAMDSARFRTLMLDLVAWSALGEWRGHANAQMPLEPYVSRRIDRLWAKVGMAGDLSAMDDEQRHVLRIQIKKLRYALEFVEALHEHERQRQKKFAKAVEELQEALGRINDLVVARTLVMAEAWPITPHEPCDNEREFVREADHWLDRPRKIGPYWRAEAR
jgi:inorganic triphosphatase YgiF